MYDFRVEQRAARLQRRIKGAGLFVALARVQHNTGTINSTALSNAASDACRDMRAIAHEEGTARWIQHLGWQTFNVIEGRKLNAAPLNRRDAEYLARTGKLPVRRKRRTTEMTPMQRRVAIDATSTNSGEIVIAHARLNFNNRTFNAGSVIPAEIWASASPRNRDAMVSSRLVRLESASAN